MSVKRWRGCSRLKPAHFHADECQKAVPLEAERKWADLRDQAVHHRVGGLQVSQSGEDGFASHAAHGGLGFW